MSSGKRINTHQHRHRQMRTFGTLITYVGLTLIGMAFAIVFATFWPAIREELGYNIKQMAPALVPHNIIPIDRNFGIIIPKIDANASITPNVDPYNSHEYQIALTHGVAHAKDTAKPGESGNIFLFSHSSVNFYEASRYNSVFYLLSKLTKGDTILLYYTNTAYTYRITSTKTVSSSAVEYLNAMDNNRQTVTLMTCWPPGTTYRRLLVIAERI